ncbi:hypothetical protein BTUL_0104g00110 [Botrytis tulipae]|uniref:Uncharacterized protein n=1 Tax=Botrytis tulipae TaxID=87230 RepID=A0A4Z1EH73_9HELO|nr:hypothetical protein BTUL_0104g00110 [Botrytis tulipae]
MPRDFLFTRDNYDGIDAGNGRGFVGMVQPNQGGWRERQEDPPSPSPRGRGHGNYASSTSSYSMAQPRQSTPGQHLPPSKRLSQVLYNSSTSRANPQRDKALSSSNRVHKRQSPCGTHSKVKHHENASPRSPVLKFRLSPPAIFVRPATPTPVIKEPHSLSTHRGMQGSSSLQHRSVGSTPHSVLEGARKAANKRSDRGDPFATHEKFENNESSQTSLMEARGQDMEGLETSLNGLNLIETSTKKSDNNTVERWLDNIKTDDGWSTVRREDDRYADRREESVDPRFGNPSQALHIGSTSRHRAEPGKRQKSSRNVHPPQPTNSSGSRSRVRPRRDNQRPLLPQQLPISGNSPRSPYSEAASQSNLPHPYSSGAHGSYNSHSISRIAPVSHVTTFRVTRPQQDSARVASHQNTYAIPTLNHTVQESSSFPQQNHHRGAYFTSERSVQGTVAQGNQRVRFRTAEGNDAYEIYLRSRGQIASIGTGTGDFSRMNMTYDTPPRDTYARDIWES